MSRTNKGVLNIVYRFSIFGEISIIGFYNSNNLWIGDYYFITNYLYIGNNDFIDSIKQYLESINIKPEI